MAKDRFTIKTKNGVKATVNFKGVVGTSKAIDSALTHTKRNAMSKAMLQWCVLWRAWAQERYDIYSKGGGKWPPLKPATIKRRRNQSESILRDTNTMFMVLDAVFRQQAGAVQDPIKNGYEIGYGGSSGHPSGKVTVSEIAEYHQEGAGNLPVRETVPSVNEIPSLVIAGMKRVTNRAIRKIIDANKV